MHTTQIAAVVPMEVADELRRLADRRDRSMAAEIRLALRAWIDSQADDDQARAA